MKRIQITITAKPRTDGSSTFCDFITDCYHTGLYIQSCGEYVSCDPIERLVFYGDDESHIVRMVNDNNDHDEEVEFCITEISGEQWEEVKQAIQKNEDGFWDRMNSIRDKLLSEATK